MIINSIFEHLLCSRHCAEHSIYFSILNAAKPRSRYSVTDLPMGNLGLGNVMA